ncbi:transposase [Emticicia aquatilis]|uniref:Transposase n=1 Tax=Emticicia aquatilis TaxID=1537369 RepID=A0A917DXC5_9BACT|nr:IS200/IS605 family transposase [Emticicia aquatilis]GGD77788.1 transposase [Emticicia aquatilis]
MANTFTQLHIQLIFAVQNRTSLIDKYWKDRLYAYMTGIIQNNGHKLLIINGMPDHVHVLIGFRTTQALSELVQVVKRDSSKWINENKLVRGKFSWQEGFAAFSYSHSHLQNVVEYIKNQEEHHRKLTFLEEYKSFLKKFEIEFDEKYIFKEIQDE